MAVKIVVFDLFGTLIFLEMYATVNFQWVPFLSKVGRANQNAVRVMRVRIFLLYLAIQTPQNSNSVWWRK